VQYPSFGTARIRHIEVVALSPTRLMTVLITDTGRVDQRLLELPGSHGGAHPAGEPALEGEFLDELRTRLNAELGGTALADAAELLRSFAATFPPERAALVAAVAGCLAEQVVANRQDRLVMAGTANLARTESDFSGSIYPVLEAIEEQVILLKLFGEMEIDDDGVSVSIGRENQGFGPGAQGLSETSVLASGYTASGGSVARLGVLGPTRMDYSNNMAAVRAVARYLTRLLGEEL
jgi:heat-inducible transcriptional repressor